MTKFKPKPPPAESATDLAAVTEGFVPPQPPTDVAPAEEPAKRGKGRPRGEARTVFGTRLKDQTIADVEALKVGLRLQMQGEAIERAVAHYKAHVIAKTRQELRLAPEVDDEAVLLKAFKVDD